MSLVRVRNVSEPIPAEVRCPDCGKVSVRPDTFDGNKPISAVCPECGERLYFDSENES